MEAYGGSEHVNGSGTRHAQIGGRNMDQRGLNRREFLKLAALAGGTVGEAGGHGGLLAACGTVEGSLQPMSY